MGYMISKKAWEDDTKKQAIIDIVDYLYSTEMQEIGLYNAGDIPARNDVEIDDAKVTVPLLADIIAYGKGKESCPNFPQTCPKTECWTDFADGFDAVSYTHLQAIVHNDEGGQPHMHFLFIPATSDQKHGGEKICANDVLNKTELRNFHPALQKWLIDHDVQANILTGITKAQGGNRTVQELSLIHI